MHSEAKNSHIRGRFTIQTRHGAKVISSDFDASLLTRNDFKVDDLYCIYCILHQKTSDSNFESPY